MKYLLLFFLSFATLFSFSSPNLAIAQSESPLCCSTDPRFQEDYSCPEGYYCSVDTYEGEPYCSPPAQNLCLPNQEPPSRDLCCGSSQTCQERFGEDYTCQSTTNEDCFGKGLWGECQVTNIPPSISCCHGDYYCQSNFGTSYTCQPTDNPSCQTTGLWGECQNTGVPLPPDENPTPIDFDLCHQTGSSYQICQTCLNSNGIWTAIGCLSTDFSPLIASLVTFLTSVAGTLALLFILYGAFIITTSAGNPQKLETGRSIITAAIIGLSFIIFSVISLQFIGVEILKIPGL